MTAPARRAVPTGRVFWHGGQAGLAVGEYILPASETGTPHALTVKWRAVGRIVGRRDRVYVTADFQRALRYAAVHPSEGHVYEVKPDGDLTPDPDPHAPPSSFACRRARIVAVVVPTREQRRRMRRSVEREIARDRAG